MKGHSKVATDIGMQYVIVFEHCSQVSSGFCSASNAYVSLAYANVSCIVTAGENSSDDRSCLIAMSRKTTNTIRRQARRVVSRSRDVQSRDALICRNRCSKHGLGRRTAVHKILSVHFIHGIIMSIQLKHCLLEI